MTQPNAHAERPSRIPWPPILLAGVIAAAMALERLAPLAWPGVDDLATRLVGRGIGLAGIALFIWSAWTLHRHGTTLHPDKAANALVTDGPFRLRRNPIYLSHLLILLGIAELTKNVWFVILAAAYAAMVTWLAILPEERHLEARFGDAYRDYKERTRRLF